MVMAITIRSDIMARIIVRNMVHILPPGCKRNRRLDYFRPDPIMRGKTVISRQLTVSGEEKKRGGEMIFKVIIISILFGITIAAAEARASALAELLKSDEAEKPVSINNLEKARADLWKKYCEEVKADSVRAKEHETGQINFSGSVMRYAVSRKGTKPAEGYPLYIALHGGGGAPPELNDGQWEQMKMYYRDSVKNGIYVAVRGISDTWNLHFMPNSYVMYDRLIENMIVFENVDPNRVYVMGYSAGGDGVYQIASRMSDRFAAGNMSAGHHNGVDPKNLFNLAFLAQVGEVDSAYDRHKATVEHFIKLNDLKEKNPEWYEHEIFVHFNKPHNFFDNDPAETKQEVIADPVKWLKEQDRAKVSKNTNAAVWLSKHKRNPLPDKVIWDLRTGASRGGVDNNGQYLWSSGKRGNTHYWLDVGELTTEELGTSEIVVSADRTQNVIMVEQPADGLVILISSKMFNLSKSLTIKVGTKELQVTVEPKVKTMVKTLLDRGDPNYIFEGAVRIIRKDGQWTAEII